MGLVIVYKNINHQYFASLLVFIPSSTKTETGNKVTDSKTASRKRTQTTDNFLPA